MDIVQALRQEETKLSQQLTAVQGVIAAFNGRVTGAMSIRHTSAINGLGGQRTMSAAGRARISRAAKARWAKLRAEKAKKAK